MKILIHTDSPALYSGLARCGRELANRFIQNNHEVFYAGWHYFNKRHQFPYFIYPLLKGSNDENKQFSGILADCEPDIILSVGDIWNFHSICSSIRDYKEIHQAAKWVLWLTVDGEHLHPSWIEVIKYADDINVFSRFAQQEILKFSGVRTNLIYPGVDKNVFKQIDTAIKHNTLPFEIGRTFLVLNVNQNTDRKNLPLTLEAFADFAKDKEDVFLFLVTNPEDPYGYDLWDFVKMFDLRKKVAITKEAGPLFGMSDAKLNLIYNLASVSMNTSIGEGLSLPTLEAMAVGAPVMSTDYAAVPELLNQGGGIKIAVDGYLYGFNGIRRALASRSDIVKNLNILYNDFKTDKKLRDYISEKSKRFTDVLTWDRTAEALMQRFTEVSKKKVFSFVRERVKINDINPLMVIPSWGTHCGIAEYTKSLFDAIRFKNQQVVVFSSYNYREIPALVKEGNYNLVHFQHEYSFFKDKEILREVLEQLHSMKVKTVLTMHTLVQGLVSYNEMLLTNLDDIIVHCDAFKNKLEQRFKESKEGAVTIPCNIDVIPMGCGNKIDFDQSRITENKRNLNILQRSPIIGSFGFLRDQKGFHDFLLSIKALRNEYPDILALLVCPQHEFGSKVYDESFFNFIEKQDLSNNVLIVREYLEEEKLLNLLQCADLFVLNYQDPPIGGGISAAVKTLFRTQRPIVVNDTIAFWDLKDEVMKIRSIGVESLVKAIKILLNDKALADKLVNAANTYTVLNNWDVTAQKHLDLYAK